MHYGPPGKKYVIPLGGTDAVYAVDREYWFFPHAYYGFSIMPPVPAKLVEQATGFLEMRKLNQQRMPIANPTA
jgi:hypothetical protein